jgi:hypothetical protein
VKKTKVVGDKEFNKTMWLKGMQIILN